MSACGPPTANVLGLMILLRTCTPLLPPPPLSRTSNCSSKSPYFFLLHRNVLNFRPFGLEPTMAPSLTLQYSSIRPSQPSRLLRLKNGSPPTAAGAAHS